MYFSRGQGTVSPHKGSQKSLGREVRRPGYETKVHVGLGCHERLGLLLMTW